MTLAELLRELAVLKRTGHNHQQVVVKVGEQTYKCAGHQVIEEQGQEVIQLTLEDQETQDPPNLPGT